MYFTVDGHEAFAYTGAQAPGAGAPAVLFVHGGGCDHTVWNLQSRYLAHHGFNVYAIDLPAHGLSSGQALASIEAMAAWVWSALDALGEERAALVGHSLGSLVALEAAGSAPARCWHLCLVGTSIPMAVTDELLSAARRNEHAAFDMVNIWGHAVPSQMGGNQSPGMWMTGSLVRLLERSGPGVLHADLGACNDYVDGLETAARVTCNSHLILGSRDIMSPPRLTGDLRATLENARTTMLDGSGHMLMGERPNQVLDAMLEGLRQNQPH